MKKFTDVYGLPKKKLFLFVLIGVVLLFTLFSSFQTIESGEVGLKVRFGKIVDSSLNEGLNLKIPYIEQIQKEYEGKYKKFNEKFNYLDSGETSKKVIEKI